MRIKEGYILQEVADTFLVMPTGNEDELKKIITLNETGAFMWRLLEKGASRDAIADATEQEYDAPRSVIEKDVDLFLAHVREAELLDE